MSRIIKTMHQNIFLYIRAPNQEIVFGNDKHMNCRCPMTAILNFTICGKTVPFTAWHTAEMDSAQKFHIVTTNEILFLKNSYRSLSRAIFQFVDLTKTICFFYNEVYKKCSVTNKSEIHLFFKMISRGIGYCLGKPCSTPEIPRDI